MMNGELLVSSAYLYPVSCPPCLDEGRQLTFLYLVLSTNPLARRAIRETWAKKAAGENLGKMKTEFVGKVVFVLSGEEVFCFLILSDIHHLHIQLSGVQVVDNLLLLLELTVEL